MSQEWEGSAIFELGLLLCLNYFYTMLARSGRLGGRGGWIAKADFRTILGLNSTSSVGVGTGLTLGIRYGLLEHKKMDEVKAKLFGAQEKTFYLKLKFILKEAKYTLAQGFKDLWRDTKWIIKLYKNKTRSEFTGYEIS